MLDPKLEVSDELATNNNAIFITPQQSPVCNNNNSHNSAFAVVHNQQQQHTANNNCIRILGINQNGAKSRVETQIKLCLQLVTERGEKVTCWSHLQLPEYMVAKEKFKIKNSKNPSDHFSNVLQDHILNLEASVVCASDTTKKVLACLGCVQREFTDLDDEKIMQLEQNKILLFNCNQIVDFNSGDIILPTRITCYCRHHNEKVGFRIKDHTNNIIATGMSPPIMITDDHKSSKIKNGMAKKRLRTEHGHSNTNNSSKKILNDRQHHKPSSPLPSSTSSPSSNVYRNNNNSNNLMMSISPAEIQPDSSLLNDSKDTSSSLTSSPQLSKNNIKQQTPSSLETTPNLISSISPIHIAPQNLSNLSNNTNSLSFQHNQQQYPPRLHDHQQFDQTSIMETPASQYNFASSIRNNDNANVINLASISCSNSIYDPTHLLQNFDSDPTRFNINNANTRSYADSIRLHNSHISNNPMIRRSFYNSNGNITSAAASTYQNNTMAEFQIPKMNKLIPSEGPMYGGIEVTVLGSGFYDTDRALMELALQVIGMKMTGKVEDALDIATRIIQTDYNDSITLQNRQQHTMLHFAATLGYQKLCSVLIEREIGLDVQDEYGFTAGADDDILNFNYQSSIDLAISRKFNDISDLIYDYDFQDSGVSLSQTSSNETIDDPDDYLNSYNNHVNTFHNHESHYSINKSYSNENDLRSSSSPPFNIDQNSSLINDVEVSPISWGIVDAEVVDNNNDDVVVGNGSVKNEKQHFSEMATDLATASTVWLQKTFAHLHMPAISKPSQINTYLPNIKIPNLHNFSSPNFSTMNFGKNISIPRPSMPSMPSLNVNIEFPTVTFQTFIPPSFVGSFSRNYEKSIETTLDDDAGAGSSCKKLASDAKKMNSDFCNHDDIGQDITGFSKIANMWPFYVQPIVQHVVPLPYKPEESHPGSTHINISSLHRMVGYEPNNLNEDQLAQLADYHNQKFRKLKQDKMLYLFWQNSMVRMKLTKEILHINMWDNAVPSDLRYWNSLKLPAASSTP
ncbi:4067_t:CDS:10 [Entrophospora sp. SA101]|nr:14955_t:CDS:10 [Entrophospora sp. SA101]CAJ0827067.1 4067_t:CDS:10 [Entrophospora sp. SA101]